MSLDVHIVSHTHWDREWYLTREQYRFRLVGLMDRVLDRLESDPRFTHFHLDGQTIVIEDYLEVRPDQAARLQRHIAAGRLLAGPWYVMPDMHLVSGESLVRNLTLGHRIADSFGGVMRAGYMPDPFGHVAQMPQIMRGFGLDSAILWRGFGGPRSEYNWRSPDGSEVLLLHLPPEGYCNALWLPLRSMEEMIESGHALVKREADRSSTGALLMMAGVDHVEPHPQLLDLPGVLSKAAGVTARISTLPAYVAAAKKRLNGSAAKLDLVEGELRSGEEYSNLLPGVLSARTYLKRENVRAQALLEKIAEPLAGAAWMLGEAHPTGILDYAWKTLLQNHPHDSICGCSVDEVHDENMTRFARSIQSAETVVASSLESLARRATAPPAGSIAALVVGTSAVEGVVQGFIDVPFEVAEAGRRFNPAYFETRVEILAGQKIEAIHDATGALIPFQVLSTDEILTHAMSRYETPLPLTTRRFKVAMFLPKTEALQPQQVNARIGDGAAVSAPLPEPVAAATGGGTWIDNGLVRVEAKPDGTVEVLDLRSGRRYPGMLALLDEGDVGDEYNFSPPAIQRAITNADVRDARVTSIAAGPLVASVHVGYEMALSAKAASDRRSRDTQTAPLAVGLEISLRAGSPRIEVRVSVDNRSSDHRLRLLFPTGAARVETTRTDAAFAVLERPARREMPEQMLQEMPVNAVPVHSVIDAGDDTSGVTVWTEGLYEGEVVGTANGDAIGITIIRATGFLSRDDLATRKGHAGPGLATPGAQCLGTHEFRLAFETRTASPNPETLLQASANFLAPPRIASPAGPIKGADATGQSALPHRAFVSIESEPAGAAIVSAMKKCADRESLVVRLFNARASATSVRINAFRPIREAHRLDLREARTQGLEVRNAAAQLELRPCGIETIELVFG